MYSSRDELMGEKHVLNIVKTFKGSYEVNDIKVNHNDERPLWIIHQIMSKIGEVLSKQNLYHVFPVKKRGLSITKNYFGRFS